MAATCQHGLDEGDCSDKQCVADVTKKWENIRSRGGQPALEERLKLLEWQVKILTRRVDHVVDWDGEEF